MHRDIYVQHITIHCLFDARCSIVAVKNPMVKCYFLFRTLAFQTKTFLHDVAFLFTNTINDDHYVNKL